MPHDQVKLSTNQLKSLEGTSNLTIDIVPYIRCYLMRREICLCKEPECNFFVLHLGLTSSTSLIEKTLGR